MGKRCIIGGCVNKKRVGRAPKPGVHYFSFPRGEHNSSRLLAWIAFVKSTRDDFTGIGPGYTHGHGSSVICSEHFQSSDLKIPVYLPEYKYERRVQLKATAIPTIRPSTEPETGSKTSKNGRRRLEKEAKNNADGSKTTAARDVTDPTWYKCQGSSENVLSELTNTRAGAVSIKASEKVAIHYPGTLLGRPILLPSEESGIDVGHQQETSIGRLTRQSSEGASIAVSCQPETLNGRLTQQSSEEPVIAVSQQPDKPTGQITQQSSKEPVTAVSHQPETSIGQPTWQMLEEPELAVIGHPETFLEQPILWSLQRPAIAVSHDPETLIERPILLSSEEPAIAASQQPETSKGGVTYLLNSSLAPGSCKDDPSSGQMRTSLRNTLFPLDTSIMLSDAHSHSRSSGVALIGDPAYQAATHIQGRSPEALTAITNGRSGIELASRNTSEQYPTVNQNDDNPIKNCQMVWVKMPSVPSHLIEEDATVDQMVDILSLSGKPILDPSADYQSIQDCGYIGHDTWGLDSTAMYLDSSGGASTSHGLSLEGPMLSSSDRAIDSEPPRTDTDMGRASSLQRDTTEEGSADEAGSTDGPAKDTEEGEALRVTTVGARPLTLDHPYALDLRPIGKKPTQDDPYEYQFEEEEEEEFLDDADRESFSSDGYQPTEDESDSASEGSVDDDLDRVDKEIIAAEKGTKKPSRTRRPRRTTIPKSQREEEKEEEFSDDADEESCRSDEYEPTQDDLDSDSEDDKESIASRIGRKRFSRTRHGGESRLLIPPWTREPRLPKIPKTKKRWMELHWDVLCRLCNFQTSSVQAICSHLTQEHPEHVGPLKEFLSKTKVAHKDSDQTLQEFIHESIMQEDETRREIAAMAELRDEMSSYQHRASGESDESRCEKSGEPEGEPEEQGMRRGDELKGRENNAEDGSGSEHGTTESCGRIVTDRSGKPFSYQHQASRGSDGSRCESSGVPRKEPVERGTSGGDELKERENNAGSGSEHGTTESCRSIVTDRSGKPFSYQHQASRGSGESRCGSSGEPREEPVERGTSGGDELKERENNAGSGSGHVTTESRGRNTTDRSVKPLSQGETVLPMGEGVERTSEENEKQNDRENGDIPGRGNINHILPDREQVVIRTEGLYEFILKYVRVVFNCPSCKKALRNLDSRLTLDYVHCCENSAKNTLCDGCGGMFSRKIYIVHSAKCPLGEGRHLNPEMVSCSICKQELHRGTLREHLRLVHEGIQKRANEPAICVICGKTLSSHSTLLKHEALHRKGHPFQCLYCHKGFNQKSNMKIHMRQHTGEQPYKCEHCPKAYTNKVCLKSHLKRYHSIDLWKEGHTGGGRRKIDDR